MKLAITIFALAVALASADKKTCFDHYGLPPPHSAPVGGPAPVPVYNPPPPPPPVYVPPPPPPPVYVPPPPPPPAPTSPYAPTGGHRDLTFVYDERCKKYGYWRDRKLSTRNLKVVSTEELVSEHGAACAHIDYDIYLVIQGAHFAGLAVPAGKENAKCPNVVIHSKTLEGFEDKMEKITMIAGDDEVAAVLDEEKLHLGSRPLSTIIEAFDGVEPGRNGQKFYDAVTNNCVSLLRNMADPLEIKIDDRMIGFVSKRMLESSAEHIFESVRASPALNTLFEGGKRMLKGVSKEDLLAKLIKLYV